MFISAIEEWLFPKPSAHHRELQDWLAAFRQATPNTPASHEGVRRMVRRGVPDALRGWAWARLLSMDEHVPFSRLQTDYDAAFRHTFGPGLQPADIAFAHGDAREQCVHRVVATLAGVHPMVDMAGNMVLPSVLGIMADYFEGEAMLFGAGQRIIVMDWERRRTADGFGMIPARNAASILQLLRAVLKKEAPALASHLAHLKPASLGHLLFTLMTETYRGTLIPCRLVDCWLVEGFKVNVRFVLAHLLLKQDELVAAAHGADLEAALVAPASRPEDLAKTAFSLHFSRKALQKKRHSLDSAVSSASCTQLHQAHQIQFGRLPKLANRSLVVRSYTQWQALWHWLPSRFQGSIAELVFTTCEHGRSLQFAYLKSALREPLVVLALLDDGSIAGAYLSKSFVCRLSGKQQNTPYGTGETFVFSLSPSITNWFWRPDPDNSGFIVSSGEEGIGVGVGACGYALHIDRDLATARSSRSPVFDNAPLFRDARAIDRLEIWGFLDE